MKTQGEEEMNLQKIICKLKSHYISEITKRVMIYSEGTEEFEFRCARCSTPLLVTKMWTRWNTLKPWIKEKKE